MLRASEFLLAQFQIKKNRNPRYSQRSFAKLIGVNPGRLTHYFSGERIITKKVAQQIAGELGFDDTQTEYFLHLCEADKKSKRAPDPRILKEDELAMIVEWYHLAVLSLVSTKDFKPEPEWIGERLGIAAEIAAASLERLARIGLIKWEGGQVQLTTGGPVSTTTGVPNQFLRLAHQDTLRHVVESMPHVPLDKRDISSITLPIDERKLQEAKTLIRTFRRKLAHLLTQGTQNQVYTLNIQLFPLSKDL